jgi:GNAT superfamily N-acetyltransferase
MALSLRSEGAVGLEFNQGMRNLEFHPLTVSRWPELEKLFGERGACGGCWCMWWRLTRSEWEHNKGEPNKAAFRSLVESQTPLGVLAFLDGQPIGWCAVGPRETLPSLARSRVLAPLDEQPVWSVTCFFVARPYRKRGVAVKLLKAGVEYARSQGARIVEGYPTQTRKSSVPDVFAFMGPVSLFERVGFREVARRSANRPFLRKKVGPTRLRGIKQPPS